jgi:hypothetical protein
LARDARLSFTIDINFNVRNPPVEQRLEQIMATLDQLIEKVGEQSTQLASLNTFVEGLQEAIRNEGLSPEDQAKVDRVFAEMLANDQRIADAFTENTPAQGQL